MRLHNVGASKILTHNFGFELQIPLAFNYTLNNFLRTSKLYARKETILRKNITPNEGNYMNIVLTYLNLSFKTKVLYS